MLSAAAPTEVAVTAGFRQRRNTSARSTMTMRHASMATAVRWCRDHPVRLHGQSGRRELGLDWVERGTMSSRSRRPVYEGDAIVIVAGR